MLRDWRENSQTRPADAKNWRRDRDTEGNKSKLIRGVKQHRCGNTIREQVLTQSWWGGGGQTGTWNRDVLNAKSKTESTRPDSWRKTSQQRAFRNAAAVTSDTASASNSNYGFLSSWEHQLFKLRTPAYVAAWCNQQTSCWVRSSHPWPPIQGHSSQTSSSQFSQDEPMVGLQGRAVRRWCGRAAEGSCVLPVSMLDFISTGKFCRVRQTWI